jgi:hypothetical protein
MKMWLFRVVSRVGLAVLRWKERELLLKNAGYRQYIADIDERCLHHGLFMCDGLVESYLNARDRLSIGELDLANLQIRIEMTERELEP